MSPILALVLTHDLLLSKRGVALPQTHGLNLTVTRYKARLSAELTKARLRRQCATLDELRARIDVARSALVDGSGDDSTCDLPQHPRWVRVNTLKSTLEQQLDTTFADFMRTDRLSDVTGSIPSSDASKPVYLDDHIPNLVAIPYIVDIAASKAYKDGKLILQDKASCFPAYLLDPFAEGDVVDACAAPGNKTTHLAAIFSEHQAEARGDRPAIIACEKDAVRSQTLEKMITRAGGDRLIRVRAKQDFLKLDPHAVEFANVSALLLDPSCSGSGIVGRDEASVKVHLPRASVTEGTAASQGKKRKRGGGGGQQPPTLTPPKAAAVNDEEQPITEDNETKLQTRLSSLAAFQLRIILHAMKFPSARRITYSTCSVHAIENEHVVVKALVSSHARERGWRIMRREEQVDGMRRWRIRGSVEACVRVRDEQCDGDGDGGVDAEEVAKACIRCEKRSGDGTMGFFVAGFVRDDYEPCRSSDGDTSGGIRGEAPVAVSDVGSDGGAEEEWTGFGD